VIRSRRLTVLAVTVVMAVSAGIGYAGSRTDGATNRLQRTIDSPRRSATDVAVATVTPKSPEALAVGPDGDLYAVDTGRDQILERLPNGRWEVIAGDGRQGFAGDGGPAVEAELRLGMSSGIAIGQDGTVYFSDAGNDRVRAVSANGRVETVVGGGRQALPTAAHIQVEARSPSLGSPAGLTFGPDDDLYIAANFIVRLSSSGRLAWVAGTDRKVPADCSATTCAMREQNFDDASAIAFDGAGDLVVTSGNFPGAGWGIGEVRKNGTLVEFGSCRGEGGRPGALTPTPEGTVICAAQTGLFRIAEGSESETPIPGAAAGGRVPSPLSAALGTGPDGPFFGGDGIAIGPDGDIYADTGPLASATPHAIVELKPGGRVETVWKS
jgi:hypothetical protein